MEIEECRMTSCLRQLIQTNHLQDVPAMSLDLGLYIMRLNLMWEILLISELN